MLHSMKNTILNTVNMSSRLYMEFSKDSVRRTATRTHLFLKTFLKIVKRMHENLKNMFEDMLFTTAINIRELQMKLSLDDRLTFCR